MNQRDLKKFKELLLAEKKKLLANAKTTMEDSIEQVKADNVLDEGDEASAEADISMVYRLRDRERYLFKKIDKALVKIDDGSFGTCEECGDEIGIKRLEARPVTDLCVKCKEDQEQREKEYAEG
jgi:DnaK suppressor protein